MKRTLKLFALMIAALIFPVTGAFATGGVNATPSSLSIEVGSTKTFTISLTNAIGDASISSNDASVASVTPTYWETGVVGDNETKTGTITVSGNAIGNATITITFDAVTFDEESLTSQTRTVAVSVIAKPEPPTPTQPEPSQSSTPAQSTPTTPAKKIEEKVTKKTEEAITEKVEEKKEDNEKNQEIEKTIQDIENKQEKNEENNEENKKVNVIPFIIAGASLGLVCAIVIIILVKKKKK